MGWLSLGVSGVLLLVSWGVRWKRAKRTEDNFSSSCNSAAPWSDSECTLTRVDCSLPVGFLWEGSCAPSRYVYTYIDRLRCVAMSRCIWAISWAADPSAAPWSPPTLSTAHHEGLKLRFSPYCSLPLL